MFFLALYRVYEVYGTTVFDLILPFLGKRISLSGKVAPFTRTIHEVGGSSPTGGFVFSDYLDSNHSTSSQELVYYRFLN